MAIGCYRPRSYRSELTDLRYWRGIIVEFWLSLIFVLLVTAFIMPMGVEGVGAPHVRGPIIVGFLVFAFVDAFDPLSGSHFHPVITLIFLLTKRLEPLKAVLYWVAQIVGGICGAGILYACSPEGAREKFGPPNLHPDVTPAQGVVLEGLATMNFMMVIQGAVATQKRPSFTIGFTVAACLMAIGEHTGGGINPIVAFSPAVLTGKWDNQWIYWVGPFTGGFLAVLLYAFFTCDLGPCCQTWSPVAGDDDDSSDLGGVEKMKMKAKNEVLVQTVKIKHPAWCGDPEGQWTLYELPEL